jgi:hypothetical protein
MPSAHKPTKSLPPERTLSARWGDAEFVSLEFDLASVMQAPRWKSTKMPMRISEHVLAGRGGMTRAAKVQGRDQE